VAPQADKKKPEATERVVLTARAAAQILKLMKVHKAKYLRVYVSPRYEYKLDLDERMNPKEDYLGESRGVPVVVDRKSSLLLPAGIMVDFSDEGGRPGFLFRAPKQEPPDTSVSLVEARRGFKTTLARRESGKRPAPEPPPELFRIVRYDARSGNASPTSRPTRRTARSTRPSSGSPGETATRSMRAAGRKARPATISPPAPTARPGS
jgi:Fe-S cluster assembly iron-binding protein IscA